MSTYVPSVCKSGISAGIHRSDASPVETPPHAALRMIATRQADVHVPVCSETDAASRPLAASMSSDLSIDRLHVCLYGEDEAVVG